MNVVALVTKLEVVLAPEAMIEKRSELDFGVLRIQGRPMDDRK